MRFVIGSNFIMTDSLISFYPRSLCRFSRDLSLYDHAVLYQTLKISAAVRNLTTSLTMIAVIVIVLPAPGSNRKAQEKAVCQGPA